LWLHSLKVAQLLRSAACLHTNQSRSYLNHLVHWSSCTVRVIVVRFQRNLNNFLDKFSKNTEISNFMKIHPVGDGRIDRHDEAVSHFTQFCICAYNRFLIPPVISALRQIRRCNPCKCEVQIAKNNLHGELSSGFNSSNGNWPSVHRLSLTIRV